MGMRLVVKVYNKEERVAQAYYHWSGRSTSSTEIVMKFINCYINNLKNKKFYDDEKIDMTYKAVKALQATGAKPWIYEKVLFDHLFSDRQSEFRFDDDRDEGILSIQKDVILDKQVGVDINLSEEIVSDVIVNTEHGIGSFAWGTYDIKYLLKKVRLKDIRMINKDILEHEHKTLDYWKKHHFFDGAYYEEMKKKIDSKTYILNEDRLKITNYDVPFNSFHNIPFDKYNQVYDFLSKFRNVGIWNHITFSINGDKDCLYELV